MILIKEHCARVVHTPNWFKPPVIYYWPFQGVALLRFILTVNVHPLTLCSFYLAYPICWEKNCPLFCSCIFFFFFFYAVSVVCVPFPLGVGGSMWNSFVSDQAENLRRQPVSFAFKSEPYIKIETRPTGEQLKWEVNSNHPDKRSSELSSHSPWGLDYLVGTIVSLGRLTLHKGVLLCHWGNWLVLSFWT